MKILYNFLYEFRQKIIIIILSYRFLYQKMIQFMSLEISDFLSNFKISRVNLFNRTLFPDHNDHHLKYIYLCLAAFIRSSNTLRDET
jgi:hypothetical protein